MRRSRVRNLCRAPRVQRTSACSALLQPWPPLGTNLAASASTRPDRRGDQGAVMSAMKRRANVGLATVLMLGLMDGACDSGEGGHEGSRDPSAADDAGEERLDGGAEADAGDAGARDARVVDAAVGTAEYSLELLEPEMRSVIDALIALGGKPIETLMPEEARIQPT